jgi:hypothetical protein
VFDDVLRPWGGTFVGEHQVVIKLGIMDLMYVDDKSQTAPVICLVHVVDYAEWPPA